MTVEKLLDIAEDIAPGVVTVRGILHREANKEVHEGVRQIGIKLARIFEPGGPLEFESLESVRAIEGDASRREIVEQHAEGIHIRTRIDVGLAFRVFRRNKIRSSDKVVAIDGRAVIRIFGNDRQAEVRQLEDAIAVKMDILGLNVSENEWGLSPGVGKCFGNTERDFEGFAGREQAFFSMMSERDGLLAYSARI